MLFHLKKLLPLAFVSFLCVGLFSSSITASAASLSDGLIAFYNFEDANYPGKDVSGSSNHLYYYEQSSSYKPSSNKMPLDNSGYKGKAAKFNGQNGLMAIPDKDGLDFCDKMTSATIAFYIKLDVDKLPSGPHVRIIDNGCTIYENKARGGIGVFTYYAGKTAGTFNIWPAFRDGKGAIYSPAATIQHNIDYDFDQWHQICITMDNSKKPAQVKLYIDGNWTQKTLDLTSGLKFSEKLFNFNLGGSVLNLDGALALINDSSTGSFVGELDEVMLFNRALTQDELKQLGDISPKKVANPPALTSSNPSSSKPSASSATNSSEKPDTSNTAASSATEESQSVTESDATGEISESESASLSSEEASNSEKTNGSITGNDSSKGLPGALWFTFGFLAASIIATGVIYFVFIRGKKA